MHWVSPSWGARSARRCDGRGARSRSPCSSCGVAAAGGATSRISASAAPSATQQARRSRPGAWPRAVLRGREPRRHPHALAARNAYGLRGPCGSPLRTTLPCGFIASRWRDCCQAGRMGIFYTVFAPVMRATRPVLPSYIARQIEIELRIGIKHLLYSRRTRRQLVQLQGCRVNTGCGYNPTPGWINLDVNSSPGIHYWDCRRGLPFSDNAVAAIYSEHMFEHFDLETEAKPFLQECRRCLRPGGVIRLVVPDAGAYLRAYGKAWESLARMRPLYRVENGWKDRWE